MRSSRLRRGNYAVLFVLTFTVMLSYLAFSIDGGRMKVAAIQAENAAEAAALAAVATIRDGGGQTAAELRAQSVADAIFVNRLARDGDSGGNEFSIEIDWGTWDWTEPLTQVGSRWQPSVQRQAVTVNATITGGGVTSIFGPAIALVNDRGNQQGSLYGQPNDKRDYSKFQITVGARAALRHRDIVLAVDASRYTNLLDVADIQDGLVEFMQELEENAVPGDRISLVAYAGEAHNYDLQDPESLQIDTTAFEYTATSPDMGLASYSIADDIDDMVDVAARFELCDVGREAWFYAYRHRAPWLDAELPNWGVQSVPPQADYFVVNRFGRGALEASIVGTSPPLPNVKNGNLYAYLSSILDTNVAGGFLPSAMADFSGLAGNQPGQEEDGMLLTEAQQCALWFWTSTNFALADTRRARVNASLQTSPLRCDVGNWWEGNIDRFQDVSDERAIPSVDCAGFGLTFDGVPSFQSPDGSPLMYLDRSYFQAGSNPGAAFERAMELFSNRTTYGEATVVLVSESAGRCGPNLENDSEAAAACLGEIDDRVAASTEALENMGVVTHVVSITNEGSAADLYLSSLTTGRGIYIQADSAADLGPILIDQIAHDIRIQVVQ